MHRAGGYFRKTTPKVVGGKPLRKNRTALTPNYYNTDQVRVVIDRQNPGKGYRHLLLKRDVLRFLELLPQWGELSIGLNAVVLAPGNDRADGWHRHGVVGLCAWERELWRKSPACYHDEHIGVLDRLGVATRRLSSDSWEHQFTQGQARAFQLLHVLLHELGHHHDRMTTRTKTRVARGESYAEQYALHHQSMIWDRYMSEFGLD